MRSRTHIPAICLGLLISWVSGVAFLRAQEPATKPGPTRDDGETGRKDPLRKVPVPDYFGQIGLTPEQRERIYKVLGEHQSRIEALEKQIADVKAQALRECEAVLTDAQREILEHRRRAAVRPGDNTQDHAPDGSKPKPPSR